MGGRGPAARGRRPARSSPSRPPSPRGMDGACLTGRLQTFVRRHGDRLEPVDAHGCAPPGWGDFPRCPRGPIGARMVAVTACRLALVPGPEGFAAWPWLIPPCIDGSCGQVGPVMARVTAIEQNRERLAALGTMAAGLAHELNNPAAAAQPVGGKARRGARRRSARRFASSSRPESSATKRRGSWPSRIRRSSRLARGRRFRRWTPPTPKRRCSRAWRASVFPRRGASPSRWPRAGVGVEWLEQIPRPRGPSDPPPPSAR